MRRIMTGIAVVMLGLIVLPVFAVDKDDKDKKDPAPDVKKADDVKKDDAKKDDAKKDDAKKDDKKETPKKEEVTSEKMIKAGTLVGKVVEVNETKKSIRVQIAYQVQKPNVGEIQAIASCKAQLAQAIASRDINQVQNLQVQIAQHSANAMTTERKTKDVQVTGTEDVKIRQTSPPMAYDDKGRPMKRSAKELKELKGDSKLPGYPGEFTDLHTDQVVRVTLVKKKETVHHRHKPKEVDPDSLGDDLPEANLIEIVAEPAK
jgi:hypothetical protein